MLFRKKEIEIKVKLYSGLHKDARIDHYNPDEGYVCKIPKGSRVRFVVKKLGLPDIYSLAYFCNGQRIGIFTKLHDGDELSCFRPSGGG